MTNAVVTKAKCILEGIEVNLEITKNWSNEIQRHEQTGS